LIQIGAGTGELLKAVADLFGIVRRDDGYCDPRMYLRMNPIPKIRNRDGLIVFQIENSSAESGIIGAVAARSLVKRPRSICPEGRDDAITIISLRTNEYGRIWFRQ
jgi:hypothetical protein